MSSQCTIYEFSTGLIKRFEESQGKWISQGFTGKLENNNCPIPEKLQSAIFRRYFSVDESLAYYNSESEQLIVVLKTIDEYSVLAVGRRETDRAYRPFLAFRYFWLSTLNNTNIDGLGTLLLWWLQAGKPHFEFSGTPNEPQLPQCCTGIDLERDNFEGNSVREIKKIIFLDEQRIITSINIDSILINPNHEDHSLITQFIRNNSTSTIFFAQGLSDKIQEFTKVSTAPIIEIPEEIKSENQGEQRDLDSQESEREQDEKNENGAAQPPIIKIPEETKPEDQVVPLDFLV